MPKVNGKGHITMTSVLAVGILLIPTDTQERGKANASQEAQVIETGTGCEIEEDQDKGGQVVLNDSVFKNDKAI